MNGLKGYAEAQAVFRKHMNTIYNIFILSSLSTLV